MGWWVAVSASRICSAPSRLIACFEVRTVLAFMLTQLNQPFSMSKMSAAIQKGTIAWQT
jgi:hypothetical protein